MLNSLIHVIIEEKLYDEQYIQANVTGFEALKAKVKDFSPEAMAPVCGIDAATSARRRAHLRHSPSAR